MLWISKLHGHCIHDRITMVVCMELIWSCMYTNSYENLFNRCYTSAESANTLLSVELSSNVPPLSLSCRLLSGLVGTSGCSISIGPSPNHLVYSSVSADRGSYGDILAAVFDADVPLQPMTVYHFEAMLLSPSNDLQCVVVSGLFTTGTCESVIYICYSDA